MFFEHDVVFVQVEVHHKAPVLEWSTIHPSVLTSMAQLWIFQLLNVLLRVSKYVLDRCRRSQRTLLMTHHRNQLIEHKLTDVLEYIFVFWPKKCTEVPTRISSMRIIIPPRWAYPNYIHFSIISA